jgi:glutathione S-transferase
MLELYHHGTSVCAAKPRILLFEKGIEWTGRYVDILAGEQFKPEYMKLNPKAVVPTLVHDGKVIRESAVICEYLDEVFPDPPLKPADAYGRARMRLWTKRMDEEIHPSTTPITYAISHRHMVISHGPKVVEEYINKMGPVAAVKRRRRIELGIDDEDARAALGIYRRFFDDLEAALGESQWLAGDIFSLAEVGITPFINRMEMLQLSGLWEKTHPRLTEWWRRIKSRPFFEPMMYGFVPPELRKLMTDKGKEAWPRVQEIVKEAA